MNRKVLGKNAVFSMLVDGIYYPVFCAKTFERPLNQDEIEVTHVNSGVDREYVPGMSNSTVSATGITQINNDEGKISIFYLDQLAIRRSIRTYRILCTDQDGLTIFITFSAFVTNSTLSKDTTAWSQSSVSFRITGPWTFSTVVPAPVEPTCEVQPTLYKTLADGGTSVNDALLIPGVGETITIISVSRSGSVHYETSGTPGSLEFRYISGTGTIEIDPTNPGNPPDPVTGLLEPMSIEYKIET